MKLLNTKPMGIATPRNKLRHHTSYRNRFVLIHNSRAFHIDYETN
ncbi:hypothetical protein pVco7_gp020 [Vibrio phage pVco-7]|uniref:Uncharacterized protein n=1 Tax=Vibrio phage pVco-5 TaxID=1965485 RepID=A0A1W6JUQ8_9CAUD|nr:hypothetical protein KNT61_gp021 [Vibrio phage pVco-5]ARM71009.1 hypothetical protein pVco5_021 [Vibrio phage pVco-5]